MATPLRFKRLRGKLTGCLRDAFINSGGRPALTFLGDCEQLELSLTADTFAITEHQSGNDAKVINVSRISGGQVKFTFSEATDEAFEIGLFGSTKQIAPETFSNAMLVKKDTATGKYSVDTGFTGALDILYFHPDCAVAAVANLTATYDNSAGTLTASTNGAITIDGQALSLNDRVLLSSQTNKIQNGIYTVTTVGSVSTPWVLTRAWDALTFAQMSKGAWHISSGTVNTGKTFYHNNSTGIIGTDAINFTELTANSGTKVSPVNTTNTYYFAKSISADKLSYSAYDNLTAESLVLTTRATPNETLIFGTDYVLINASTGAIKFTAAGVTKINVFYPLKLSGESGFVKDFIDLCSDINYGSYYNLSGHNITNAVVYSTNTATLSSDLYTVNLTYGTLVFNDQAGLEAIVDSNEQIFIKYANGQTRQTAVATQNTVDMYLKFDGINTADNDAPISIVFNNLSITPASGIDFLAKDLTKVPVVGELVADELVSDADVAQGISKYCTITHL